MNILKSNHRSAILVGLWMVAVSVSWSLADARSAQNVGNQSMGDGDISINSESSKDNAARDLLSSSSAASASMKDGDPQLVLENQMSPRGDEEKDSKFLNENNDKDGRVPLTAKSAINDGSDISEHPPGTEKGRMASDGSKDRTGNSPNEGKSIPAYGGEYLSGMEWILQKVIGDSGLANDSTGDVQKENKDSVKQNKTTDLLHSGNVTAASATVGISSNSANVTTFNNASSSQSTNASHSYKVSGLNATNVTNSNSTSPNKSPSGGSSAALTLVKLLLASLYVAGPSAGIFLISPIYAIATRNLMDYFIGSPETVDLLHGAGILGLVVDLTWGAVD